MKITINDFATDEEIETLWRIAERIIKEGHVYDDPNYKIELNLITEDYPKFDHESNTFIKSKGIPSPEDIG